MSNKSYGTRKEREVRHILEDLGAKVIRSAGSLGPFDLVGFLDGIVLIQIKASRNRTGQLTTNAERETMRNFLPEMNASGLIIKECWEWRKDHWTIIQLVNDLWEEDELKLNSKGQIIYID